MIRLVLRKTVSATITVLANDSDVDGDAITVTQVNGSAIVDGGSSVAVTNGSVALVGGELVFTPSANYNGPASFTYTISDGVLSDTATVSGTVTAVNDDPDATANVYTIVEDTVSLSGNLITDDTGAGSDGDVDGDPVTVTSFTIPGQGGPFALGLAYTIVTSGPSGPVSVGDLTVNGDGSFSFAPVGDYNSTGFGDGGVPQVFYTIGDGAGGSSTATLDITVTPVNDAPVAVADSATGTEDGGAVTGDVITNDTDVDGDALSIIAATVDINGDGSQQALTVGVPVTLSANGGLTSIGDMTLNSDGTFSFAPAVDYNTASGTPFPTVTYTLSDGSLVDTATLDITITPVNDAPDATANVYTVVEDSAGLSGNVLGDDTGAGIDSDVDGDALSVASFTIAGQAGPFNLGVAYTITNVGDLTVSGDGSFTFVPVADYSGPVPTVGIVVSDGTLSDATTLTITVTPVNDAPDAVDDTFSVAEDGSATITVLTNDSDVDGDAVSVTQVNGSAIVDGGSSVAVTNGSVALVGGQLVFTPSANYNSAVGGPVSFTYTISDGVLTDTATVSGTVTAVNDAPDAVDDTFSVAEDGSATITVLTNDSDVDGDAISVTQVNGTAIVDGGSSVAVTNGSVALVGGQLVFTPSANYNGPASFTYTISDGTLTDTATVSGTVTAVNDAPDAVDDTFSVAEDGSATITVLTNDSDVDGDAVSVTQVNGSAIVDGGSSVAVTNGSVALVGGQLVFTPSANYNGPASFTYTISDGALSDTATVTGLVTPVNDAPVAVADSATAAEDSGPVTGDVTGNDSDPDGDGIFVDVFTVAGVAGTFTAGDTATIAGVGDLTLNINGSWSFAPLVDYNSTQGPAFPTVTYTLSDGLLSDTATLDITITPVNDAPVAVADTAIGAEDGGNVTGNVVSNDSDPDGDGIFVDVFTVAGIAGTFTAGDTATIAGVGDLTLNINGSWSFAPLVDYNSTQGPAFPTVTYTLSDGSLSTTSTLDVTITAVNDAPDAVDDTFSVAEDGSATITVLTNDSDVDGDAITVTQVNGTAIVDGGSSVAVTNGSVALVGGQLVFTPSANYNGPASFTYTISDGTLTDTATVSGTVTAVNDAPDAVDDTFSVAEDGSATITVLTNDSDVDGDPLSVSAGLCCVGDC